MTILRTARLELRLRSPDAVREELAALPPEHRAQVSPEWLARVERATAPDPWVHGFSAVTADGTVVGQGAFKAPPAGGVVEIAYAVDPAHQRQGYATEIAQGLTAFALSRPEIALVRAHTLPDGEASQRVLAKCGFRHVGLVSDPEDGTVSRFDKARDPG